MSQSLSKLYVHLIFHIKNSFVLIRKQDKKDLYAYMGSIIKDTGSMPILINGMGDHVHIALAKLIEEIKRHSSRWIKTIDQHYKDFAWQGGYAGFSVSQSLHDKTKLYIENQEEHHKKLTFRQELEDFLIEYGIDYNEQYLWTD